MKITDLRLEHCVFIGMKAARKDKILDSQPQPFGSLNAVVKRQPRRKDLAQFLPPARKRVPRPLHMKQLQNQPAGYCHPPNSPFREAELPHSGFQMLVIIPHKDTVNTLSSILGNSF